MKRKITIFMSFLITGGVIASLVVAMLSIRTTLTDFHTEISRSTADAVLASASIVERASITVPVLYYEQIADPCVDIYDPAQRAAVSSRQFEWSACGYYNSALEPELTSATLGTDYLPTADGGLRLPNRGVKGDNFTRWFHAVDGLSTQRASTLTLTYADSTFTYEDSDFQPVSTSLFTMNLAVPFRVIRDGHETFILTADDDTWIYLDSHLILDLGGIHPATTASFTIHENGEVYTATADEDFAYSGLTLNNDSAIVRIFHANRDSGTASTFAVHFTDMILNLTPGTTLASTEAAGEAASGTATEATGGAGTSPTAPAGTTSPAVAQIAYDPTDPGYIAPLGESLTVKPNHATSLMNTIIAEVAIVAILAVLLIAIISSARRYWRHAHTQA